MSYKVYTQKQNETSYVVYYIINFLNRYLSKYNFVILLLIDKTETDVTIII